MLRKRLYLRLLLLISLCLGTICLVSRDAAADDGTENREHKEIMKISGAGLVPSRLVLTEPDSSVFFFNATDDSLLSLTISFKERRFHCASPNLQLEEGGVLRSKTPIGPRDFAITCFPDRGTYQLIIEGLSSFPRGLAGEIIVQ